ncbi:Aminomethyltransferase folate-binding domain-containing protein [Gonapodya prolifera JEL478]|uniref:Aminomethyltransferase folate-binding domain-containing protein n=1 Tax=Gonapodya prolifera (strain JEL478) TaxID=1344416 RepID=A0A139AMP9_GONPJ|nr:Aminomethyltransferase folate-binding domain-containing protein [Gonapodya prolifera JEL478]|eukprot:KXS18042.1 Aminomethyltransferase folate-binding domain-containing protein [Gonapodya prolifera JEL478]
MALVEVLPLSSIVTSLRLPTTSSANGSFVDRSKIRIVGGTSALIGGLKPGDKVNVVDLEGRQPCEVVVFESVAGKLAVNLDAAAAAPAPTSDDYLVDTVTDLVGSVHPNESADSGDTQQTPDLGDLTDIAKATQESLTAPPAPAAAPKKPADAPPATNGAAAPPPKPAVPKKPAAPKEPPVNVTVTVEDTKPVVSVGPSTALGALKLAASTTSTTASDAAPPSADTPNPSADAKAILSALSTLHFDTNTDTAPSAYHFFSAKTSAPHSGVSLTITSSIALLISAPSSPMTPDAIDPLTDRLGPVPPTDLIVIVERSGGVGGSGLGTVGRKKTIREPPLPLAKPKLDIRVKKATAVAYEVEEGDYIQVIDISGQQCSDFLAYAPSSKSAMPKLLGLDPTVTRTINGTTYPGPGLFNKFFNEEMVPLVEVVRDTVGRHDTFGLACTAKYYEDMGYPGHPNCTDNFGAALAPYGIAPAASYQAINLFYNTAVSSDHTAIGLEEPWSRPGDYVLFRALTKLVCSSSACPDDIDPANGWDPSEIQVRIYSKTETFTPAIATRITPAAQPTLTKFSGFHPRTSKLTRSFTPYRGYWLPTCFTKWGPLEEYKACRERVTVCDLSALRKFEVLGPDAGELLERAVTREVRKMPIAGVTYTGITYPTGCLMDDATIARLSSTNYRLVCGDPYVGQWLRALAARLGLHRVWIKSSTDHLHNIAVQGPKSRATLEKCIWTPPVRPNISELGWFKLTIGRIGGPTGVPVLVTRTGYTGELGFEVWSHPKDACAVWDAVWEAGQEFDIAPMGLDALDMVRVEAGLIFAGYEFDDTTDPFEAGIGFACPATKTTPFVGAAALANRRAHPQRTLVSLKLKSNDCVSHGQPVFVGRYKVGVVTSGVETPLFGHIGLARVLVQYAKPGTQLEVGQLDGYAKRVRAEVGVTHPLYDPEKKKPRGVAM